jgi:hypothetical protein
MGAVVAADGKPYHPYAVFKNAKNGKSGVVIANYNETTPVSVSLALKSGEALKRFRVVGEDAWQSAGKEITIPPLSAVVVVD